MWACLTRHRSPFLLPGFLLVKSRLEVVSSPRQTLLWRILMRIRLVTAAACLAWTAVSSFCQEAAPPKDAKPLYLDTRAPVEQRVQDLVSRMTLEEKASQMKDVA